MPMFLVPGYHYVACVPIRPMPNIESAPESSPTTATPSPSSDLMAILPYPVAPPKNPQQKAGEQKKVS